MTRSLHRARRWSVRIVLRKLIPVIVIAAGITPETALAGNLPMSLVEQGWEEITFDHKIPNSYAACGEDCVAIETSGSVSMIGHAVHVDPLRTPIASWEWRVENPVVVSDLSKKGGDDRAIAVYIAFAYDPAVATFAERMLRPFVTMIHGSDTPGRGLSYVWGGDDKRGDIFPSPYQKDTTTLIIQRTGKAPIGVWIRETVDIAADYERAFGAPPSAVTGILLSADSDDTGANNRAEFRSLTFRAR